MSLQGVKVSVSREGKFGETQGGKIHIENGRFMVKKLIGKKDLFGLEAVQALEHRGKKLVVRLPGTFFVIEFSGKSKDESAGLKSVLAQLTEVAVMGDANTFVLEKEHIIAAVVIVVALIGAAVGGGDDNSDKSPANPTKASSASSSPTPQRPSADPTSQMVDTLWTIDGASQPKATYRGLLELVHLRFPAFSTTKIGDMAAKAKSLCAKDGHKVLVIAPLYALKNATDGFTPEMFEKMFANNPPPGLLALWVGTGCN